jgi:putative ABC transport system substrate-binding protein
MPSHTRSRRQFLQRSAALAGLSLLSGCQSLSLRASPRVPRIAVFHPGVADDPVIGVNRDAFRQGLQELGYTQDRNIAVDWHFAEGHADRNGPVVADLIRGEPDVILTVGQTAGLVHQATTTIPIVLVMPGDPASVGLVESIAHPGGNTTGLSGIAPELAAKRLDLLKEAVPSLTSVATLWNPGDQTMLPEMGATRMAADRLGLRFEEVEVRDESEMLGAFQSVTERRIDGLVVVLSPLFNASRQRMVQLAAVSRLPTISADREFAAAGGLMAYGPRLVEMWHRAASYVDKLLKGAKPGDLPVERPTTFDFFINLQTAQALGLTIPPSVLQQATEVIQ